MNGDQRPAKAVAGGERRLRLEAGHFEQAAEVARLAVELAKGNGEEPESLIERAWKLIEQARETVAPALMKQELLERNLTDANREFENSGGKPEKLTKIFHAEDALTRISYRDLICEEGNKEAGETEIWSRFWVGPKPSDTRWKKLGWEGFCELVGRYARARIPNDKDRAARFAKEILEEFRSEGGMSIERASWLLEFRQAGLSERNKKAAKTRGRKKART